MVPPIPERENIKTFKTVARRQVFLKELIAERLVDYNNGVLLVLDCTAWPSKSTLDQQRLWLRVRNYQGAPTTINVTMQGNSKFDLSGINDEEIVNLGITGNDEHFDLDLDVCRRNPYVKVLIQPSEGNESADIAMFLRGKNF
jgi:hypothetical protein